MTDTRTDSPGNEPAPLDVNEMMSLVGASVIVAGVFCPAMIVRGSYSLIEFGNTFAAIMIGLATAIAWSVFRRRTDPILPLGFVCVAVVAVYGFYVWHDVLREPPRPTLFFGPIEARIHPTAWVVLFIGSTLVTVFGFRARTNRPDQPTESDGDDHRLVGASVTLATLGCLWGIALVNPFGDFTRGVLAEIRRDYEAQLQLLRWAMLAVSMAGVLFAFWNPTQAIKWARPVLRVFVWFIGNSLLLLITATLSNGLYSVMGWAIGSYLFITIAADAGTVGRWKWRVLAIPFLVAFSVLLVAGDGVEFFFLLSPIVLAVGAGYLTWTKSSWASAVLFVTLVLLGIASGGLLVDEIPNEILGLCGLNEPEGHLIAFGLICLLCWIQYLLWNSDRDETIATPSEVLTPSYGDTVRISSTDDGRVLWSKEKVLIAKINRERIWLFFEQAFESWQANAVQ